MIFRYLFSFEFRMYIFGEDRTIMADQGLNWTFMYIFGEDRTIMADQGLNWTFRQQHDKSVK